MAVQLRASKLQNSRQVVMDSSFLFSWCFFFFFFDKRKIMSVSRTIIYPQCCMKIVTSSAIFSYNFPGSSFINNPCSNEHINETNLTFFPCCIWSCWLIRDLEYAEILIQIFTGFTYSFLPYKSFFFFLNSPFKLQPFPIELNSFWYLLQ